MRFLFGPILIVLVITISCSHSRPRNDMPSRMLWAWERPEDLRFIDPDKFGVAFLAQTLTLQGDEVGQHPRRQPLRIRPGTYLVAVTRIESSRDDSAAAKLSAEQKKNIVEYLKKTIELPDVTGLQIDFDARRSEREFYKGLLADLRAQLPENYPVTITALTSWCSGDIWLNGLPIDDAVPMVFDMGPDERSVNGQLSRGVDWQEPACKNSYGVSLDTQAPAGLRPERRFYYFKSTSWRTSDLEKIDHFHEK